MASLHLVLEGLQGNAKGLEMTTTTQVRNCLRTGRRIGMASARDRRLEKLVIEQLDRQIRELDNRKQDNVHRVKQ